MKNERLEKNTAVVLCKGKLCSDHCRNCAYFDTSRPMVSGGSRYKCVKTGNYHRADDPACSRFVRG